MIGRNQVYLARPVVTAGTLAFRADHYRETVTRRGLARVVELQRSAPGLFPSIVVLAVVAWWAAKDGGSDMLVWAPGSLVLVALTVLHLTTAPGRFPGGRALTIGIGCLFAFTCWCYLSMSWSETPDLAWSGSNLTAVYLAVFVLFVWRPWPASVAAALIGVYALSIAGVGLVTYLRAAASNSPTDYFIAGRLAAPIAYSNAGTALFLSGALPALFLASRREVHWALRGAFFASVGVLAELALMCQSRTTFVAVPLTLLIFVALTPGRTRIAVVLAPVTAVVAGVGARPVLDVYQASVSGEEISSSLATARTAILVTIVLLFAGGAAVALCERRFTVPRAAARGAGIAIVVVLLAGAGIGTIVAVDRYHPRANAAGWWDRFKGGSDLYEAGTPHLISGFGSGRYDIWRVGFHAFERRPMVGTGVDTFGVEYLRHRTRLQDPLYPHSIELRTLVETGIVGTALLLGFFVAVGVRIARNLRQASELARGVVATCVAVVAYWLIHGSVDWLWEVPVLGAFAFACIGLACTTVDVSGKAAPAERAQWLSWVSRLGPRIVPSAMIVGGLVLGLSLAFPWFAAREIDAASSGWAVAPGPAFERLKRARIYNPLSDQPDIYAGVIAGEIGDQPRQRAAFERALDRSRVNWYPYLALGALDARQGNVQAGLQALEQARRLNPIEPVILAVEQRVRDRKPPSNAEIDTMLIDRVDLLTGGTQP